MTQQFDLGVHYFLQEEWHDAARSFREVLREEPHEARAWSLLGMALAHLGEGAEAEAALTQAVSLAPHDGEAWFHMGVARSLRQNWGPAVTAFRKAVALLPEDLVAWHRLGVALSETGDTASAAAAFERALVLSQEAETAAPEAPVPTSAGVPLDRHLAEAAVREDSQEVESWLTLALSLLSLGEEEEAVAAYERAFTIDPERAQGSLFRPMLRLLTVAEGRFVEDTAGDRPAPPVRSPPTPRLSVSPSRSGSWRPEVG
ncbi:MAG: tetratricopeptide repeat protein [Thermoplasmata archaeon]